MLMISIYMAIGMILVVWIMNYFVGTDITKETVELGDATVYMEVGPRFIFVNNIRGSVSTAKAYINYISRVTHVELSEIVAKRLDNVDKKEKVTQPLETRVEKISDIKVTLVLYGKTKTGINILVNNIDHRRISNSGIIDNEVQITTHADVFTTDRDVSMVGPLIMLARNKFKSLKVGDIKELEDLTITDGLDKYTDDVKLLSENKYMFIVMVNGIEVADCIIEFVKRDIHAHFIHGHIKVLMQYMPDDVIYFYDDEEDE